MLYCDTAATVVQIITNYGCSNLSFGFFMAVYTFVIVNDFYKTENTDCENFFVKT
jgi:hypothetical protein